MFNIRREQGRLAEVEPSVRRFIDLYPMLKAWRAALALLLIELGRVDEARAEFEALAGDDMPRDANWLIGVTLLAEVCGALGDGARAEPLYALLEPYAGRNVVVGRAATCNGAASRLLGTLAAAMRSWELAEGHFIDALAMHERMGARPWVARTQLAYAEMLLARRRRGDKARARDLLADAVLTADALGMGVVAQRARDLVPAGSPGRARAVARGERQLRLGRAAGSATASSRSVWRLLPRYRRVQWRQAPIETDSPRRLPHLPTQPQLTFASGGESSGPAPTVHRPMAKPSTVFVCSACGTESAKWHGQCPGCGAWNTLAEEAAPAPAKARAAGRAVKPVRLADVRGRAPRAAEAPASASSTASSAAASSPARSC